MTAKEIRRVAVVGGGPSGMGVVKTLNAEPFDFDIDLYETRSALGGIWNYLSEKSKYQTDEQILEAQEHNFSPMYNQLETNILHKSMQFTGFPFPENSEDFPSRSEVLKYLQLYSKSIGACTKHLNTKVTSVLKTANEWEVSSENVLTGQTTTKFYDAVVVANGHFEVPRYPEVRGLQEWRAKSPASISHAKFYDTPDAYKDETVLIVGGVASGSDIAIQISLTAKKVYVSCDEATILAKIANPYIELVSRIDQYDVDAKAVVFGGNKISGIDKIIFCTGYLYDVPFLRLDICKQRYIQDLYKHIFYSEDPSLAFVGLGKDVNPFPFAETQGSIIARYFSGRLLLPPKKEMIRSCEEELLVKGVRLHGLKFPKEAEYIADLYQMIEDQNLLDGFMFEKYEGDKLRRKKLVPELKLKRVIANNDKAVAARQRGEREQI